MDNAALLGMDAKALAFFRRANQMLERDPADSRAIPVMDAGFAYASMAAAIRKLSARV